MVEEVGLERVSGVVRRLGGDDCILVLFFDTFLRTELCC